MNSFRAFKLKLPKPNGDDFHDDVRGLQGQPSLGMIGHTPFPYYPSPMLQFHTNLETESRGTRTQNTPLLSTFLPPICNVNKSMAGKTSLQDNVLPDKLSHYAEFNSNNYNAPILPSLSYPRNQSITTPPFEIKREAQSQNDSFRTRYASPPLNDSDTVSKCSSSPGSSDSGYPASFVESPAGENELDIKVEDDKREGSFECSYCSRAFSYLCHLKVHERVHTGEKPYSCKYCPQQFSQLGSLTVHMRIHTGAKPYECNQCSKKFRHVNSLRRHQRQVHNITSNQISATLEKRAGSMQFTDSSISLSQDQTKKFTKTHKRKHSFIGSNEMGRDEFYQSRPTYDQPVPPYLWHFSNSYSDGNNVMQPGKPRNIFYSTKPHRSKFLRELEMSARLQNSERTNDLKQTAAKALLSLSENKSSIVKDTPKKTIKTWRPFSSDDESDSTETHQCKTKISNDDNKNNETYNNSQSWFSLGLTCLGSLKVEKPNKTASLSPLEYNTSGICRPLPQRYDEQMKLYPNTSRYLPTLSNQGSRDLETILAPPFLWPSPLSLRSVSDRTEITKNSEEDSHNQLYIDESSNKVENEEEKEEKSSDEGFSSACSTGEAEARSPNSSLEELKSIEDSMIIMTDMPELVSDNKFKQIQSTNKSMDVSG